MSQRDLATEHLGHLARGGLLALAGSAVAAGAGLALALVVSHGLPADAAGLFFTTTAAFSLLAVGCLLGVDSGLARFALRLEAEGRSRELGRLMRVAMAPALATATVIGVVAAFAAAHLAPDGLSPTVLRLLALALPCAVAAELLLAATRSFGQVRPTVAVDRLLRAGTQPVVVLVLLATGGVGAALVGWASVYLVSTALAVLALRRALASRPRPDTGGGSPHPAPTRGLARSFWSFTAPRGVAGLAQVTVQKADILLVALLLGPAPAAVYVVATRFVAIGQLANQAVHQVLQPRLTALLVAGDRRALDQVFTTATTWGLLLVWPFYLAVGAAAPTYLGLFGGATSSYAAGTSVVVLMALAMMVAVATGPLDTLLLMAGRSGASLAIALVAMAVDLVLCVVLLPVLGLVGAAVAWACAVLVRSGLATIQVARTTGTVLPLATLTRAALIPVVAVGLPVATWTWSGGRSPTTWLLVTVLAGVAYVLALHRWRHRLGLDLLADALRHRRPAAAPTTPTSTTPTPTTPTLPPSRSTEETPCPSAP
jgi:O-antigen/teichoic acid export membrane protein